MEAGLKAMFRTGYNGTSVRDVTAAAGAPQGSFTNHFRSKEAFASEVLERYFAHTRGLVADALDDGSLTPRARLSRYLDIITGRLEADGFSRGCLIGDLQLGGTQQLDRALEHGRPGTDLGCRRGGPEGVEPLRRAPRQPLR